MEFKAWLENTDIFGFEKTTDHDVARKRNDGPIKILNLETLSSLLLTNKIGNKPPTEQFINEITWGTGPGALKIKIHTDLHVEFFKANYDLEGRLVWSTKKIFQIDKSGKGGTELALAQEITEQLEQIDRMTIDSAKKDFDIENLIFKLSSKLKRTITEIFFYEGILKVDEGDYIIRFGCRGHGVLDQDQKRVEENQTRVIFRKDKGIIEIWNYNIESPLKQRSWEIQQNDTNVFFFPTQSVDEICEAMATALHWY